MSYAPLDNVRRLFADKNKPRVPAKPPAPKSTFQKNIDAHFNMANDGLQHIRHLPDMGRLIDILSLNRCADGPGLPYLLAKYLNADAGFKKDNYDLFGNRFLTIPLPDGSPPRIAFTSHCDTMSDDKASLYHVLKYNKDKDIFFRTDGNCLGADDGTGIWLMLNMIDAKVPGLYCFYLDEETGRQGSEWSWTHDESRYHGIDTVISFDRKDTKDIIATQRSDRCCSIEFQRALAELLSSEALEITYVPGAAGSFTDSATFMDDIAECTNLSVGYDKQHSPQEIQLVHFASRLMSTLRLIGHLFHERLPVERDPVADAKAKQNRFTNSHWPYQGGNYGYSGYRQPSQKYEDELDAMAQANGWYGRDDPSLPEEDEFDDDDFTLLMTSSEYEALQSGNMQDLVYEFPDAIESLLLDMGWDEDEVAEHIAQTLFGTRNIRNADTDTSD